MQKKSILKKTAQVSILTALSRFLGIIREFLTLRFFGLGAYSDAFNTAWGLPNFFRKIFAEGALSAAFIPHFVKMVHNKEKDEANGLMTISMLFFEGILLALCIFVILHPVWVVKFFAPGYSQEQINYAVPLLQILFPFIFFISSSALLAGALQSVNHFFIPAASQPLMNIIWIASLGICMYYNFSAQLLCVGIMLGGVVQLLLHIVVYFHKGFAFGAINKQSIQAFRRVIGSFIPSFFGASIMEGNLVILRMIVSYLPEGSVSMIYYGNRFMQIPLGMFAIAFSTILLPHFSKVILYAPKRMNFYLLEIAKFVTWVIVPATFFLLYDAHQIFSTFLPANKASNNDVTTATGVLMIYSVGLIFFSLNKVFTSIFYAYKNTWAPAIGFIIFSGLSVIGSFIGKSYWGIYGVVIASVFSGMVLTGFFIFELWRRHGVRFYVRRIVGFLGLFLLQGTCAVSLFLGLHHVIFYVLQSSSWYAFLYTSWGYWFLEAPLIGLTILFLIGTRKLFGLKMHFLDH